MNASILDLRYKTRRILRALENRERIMILYHGKPKGTIVPLTRTKGPRVREHKFFGMSAPGAESVKNVMKKLRSGRYDF
jgi:antitoxin (DNA-binding transcriptional repressor) of toxin-antitoxin stability system